MGWGSAHMCRLHFKTGGFELGFQVPEVSKEGKV